MSLGFRFKRLEFAFRVSVLEGFGSVVTRQQKPDSAIPNYSKPKTITYI